MIPTKCAKCAGPGNRTLYRRELPPGVPGARCTRERAFWAIPLCALHYSTVSRCRTNGCSGEAQREGLCWGCGMQSRRQALHRNVSACLRCRRVFGEGATYRCSGLCRECYRDAVAAGESMSVYRAMVRRLNGGGSAVLMACQAIGATEVAARLGVSLADVMTWAKGTPPVAVEDKAVALVDELKAEERRRAKDA